MCAHSLPAESHSFVGLARETAATPPEKKYISVPMVHIQTHTLAQHGRRNENANEVTMPMKCQAPPPGREAGNAKEETTHLTQNGQTLKGQGQKKI